MKQGVGRCKITLNRNSHADYASMLISTMTNTRAESVNTTRMSSATNESSPAIAPGYFFVWKYLRKGRKA